VGARPVPAPHPQRPSGLIGVHDLARQAPVGPANLDDATLVLASHPVPSIIQTISLDPSGAVSADWGHLSH
jgi:hypothetical protein